MDEVIRIKRKKTNNEGDRNGDENQSAGASLSVNTTAIVGTSSNNESQPKLFKLNVDCFEDVFEWFSLKELLVFRQTCKRMKAVVDYYIKLKYPDLLHLRVWPSRHKKFLESSRLRLNYFEWINKLYLYSVTYTDVQIESIKTILNQLETLKLTYVTINGDFYETVLKHCPRLKFLSVRTNVNPIIGTSNKWLLRQYPTLERMEMETAFTSTELCTELLEFFNQNPNIRVFSINYECLWYNRKWMLESNIKLDRLNIIIEQNSYESEFQQLVINLSKQGFYKQLSIDDMTSDGEFVRDRLQSSWLCCNLDKLSVLSFCNVPMSVLEHIKQLHSTLASSVPNLNTNFLNLERVSFLIATVNIIQMFMSHAPKLKQILVYSLVKNAGEMPNIRDFLALNEQRKKLAGARKVTIYVDEKIFLKMKWSSKLNFSMIQLKRIRLYEIPDSNQS